MPGMLLVQATPPPGFPSSGVPSQSSSTPLHVSVDGAPGVQVCGAPATQFWTVTWQAPVPHVVLPSPSSVCPLQLSSKPLHVSAVGACGVQVCGAPATQFCIVT